MFGKIIVSQKGLPLIIVVLSILICGCNNPSENQSGPEILLTREEAIPVDVSKYTPEMDVFPPVLHSDEWMAPTPMEGPINTAGAEDSPFVSPDGNMFFFFFTPDVRVPPHKQLIDGVTGIWFSQKIDGAWTEPERIILNDDVSLDGAEFVQGDTLWFGSVRPGNYGEIDIYTAKYREGSWVDVENAGEQLNLDYDIGEFHITSDGNTLYFGRGNNDRDLWMTERTEGGWSEPVRVPDVNSDLNEDQPYISPDGEELWFTGQSRMGYTGPAVFRSVKTGDGSWSEPEEIISNFAGEPTLDEDGNIYFVHHFFDEKMNMIEADIYVSYHK